MFLFREKKNNKQYCDSINRDAYANLNSSTFFSQFDQMKNSFFPYDDNVIFIEFLIIIFTP